MKLTLSLLTAASGRLSGVVATSGRTGAQLRAHTPRTQPRSPSQQTARALTGSLPAIWRRLAAADRAAWQASRNHARSGYTAFVASARNLATVGFPPVHRPLPPSAPIPPIHTLSAIPGYSQPSPPRYLTSFPVFIDPTIPPLYYAVIRATQGLSATKGNIRPSDLRVVAIMPLTSGYSVDCYTGWVAAWGGPVSSGTVTFQANLIDPATGLAGPPIRCSAYYSTPPVPDVQPGTVTILQNGTVIAVETNTVISFGGVPVAGA